MKVVCATAGNLRREMDKMDKMAKCLKMNFAFLLSLLLLFMCSVTNEKAHAANASTKYEQFIHNIRVMYFLDKNETIEVWAKVVPFPWQDNRLLPGLSDPFLVKFNASCVEEIESKGVVTRNMTAQISQVPRESNASSVQDKAGNATFYIRSFEDNGLHLETEIIVGCPPGRNMSVLRSTQKCSVFENYTFTIPRNHNLLDLMLPLSRATVMKTVQYDFMLLGCPLQVNYYDTFKPTLLLLENGKVLRNVSANYVVFELNGRTDYSFSATMAQVGCLREAQTFQSMINTTMDDVSLAWMPQNYRSCFILDASDNMDLNQAYEILNNSGITALSWHGEGVYVFQATVVDPAYSFCNLTTTFAVHVSGIESEQGALIPFLVLGTSVFGILSIIFIVFVISKN